MRPAHLMDNIATALCILYCSVTQDCLLKTCFDRNEAKVMSVDHFSETPNDYGHTWLALFLFVVR